MAVHSLPKDTRSLAVAALALARATHNDVLHHFGFCILFVNLGRLLQITKSRHSVSQ
jgi:hypothetical protein